MTRVARVFVNGVPLDVPPESTALDAVRIWSADAAESVTTGARVITDSRGLPAPPDAKVEAGAIFRVIGVRSKPSTTARDEGDETSEG